MYLETCKARFEVNIPNRTPARMNAIAKYLIKVGNQEIRQIRYKIPSCISRFYMSSISRMESNDALIKSSSSSKCQIANVEARLNNKQVYNRSSVHQ